MTTIAWKGREVAADSLITCNGARDGYGTKIHRVGRVIVGGAGGRAVCMRFRDWVKDGMQGASPFTDQDGNGLLVAPGHKPLCFGSTGPFPVELPYYALGSGECWAMAAMALGASAQEAVEFAMQHDVGSGGEITVLRA